MTDCKNIDLIFSQKAKLSMKLNLGKRGLLLTFCCKLNYPSAGKNIL